MAYKKKHASPVYTKASPPDRLYSPSETAELLGVAPQTLAHWRVRGVGPKYVHLSKRCVRYSASVLLAWLEGRVQASTVENDRQG